MVDSESAECPLCMESLEIDDLNFYPCSCGYQICRFCWHRIRTDENGLCPACRKAYSEDPAIYRPLTQDEISRINKERKQRETQRKQKISENRKHLSNVRVIQKNLLFVVGLSQRLADAELLKKQEYFGKFGKILKIVVNPSTNYAGPQGPSASAYITFSKDEETLRAILGVNNVHLYGRTIRASLGTTKYCTHYLRNTQCHKADCMYLHEAGDESGSFTKEDMQQGKHQLYEKELLENYLKSVQNKRKSEDLEQFPQMLDEEKEIWLEEDVPVSHGSALPANAAWAGKDGKQEDCEEQDKEEQIDSYKVATHVEENPSPTPQSAVASVPLSDPIEIYNKEESIQQEDNQSLDDPSSLPKELIEPQFATGWATSGEITGSNEFQEIAAEDPGGTRFQIPAWLDDGLGLNNLRVDVDDDLGFDPFTESHRGLEDFMATNHDSYNTKFYPGGNWQNDFDASSSGVSNYLPSSEYSLFGKAVSTTGSSFFDVWGGQSVYSPETAIPTSQSVENPLQVQDGLTGELQGEQQSDIKSWQDGLRALLPNINISFSASLENDEDSKSPRKAARNDTSKKEKKRSPPGLAMGQTSSRQLYATKATKEIPGIDRNPPVASWNSIVSGQPAVGPSKTAPQGSPPSGKNPLPHGQNPQQGLASKPSMSSGATAVVKPLGKSNPMFSISSSQNTNKPTAKVKPLKCVVPSEDFLAPIVGAAPTMVERRSGMNDLDDIDFNDPLPPVRIQQVTQPILSENGKITEEYQGQGSSWKKSNKKKKKKRDVNGKDVAVKSDGMVQIPTSVLVKQECETRKSILERPQSKEAKEKSSTKILKAKGEEKPVIVVAHDPKTEKTNGKSESKDAVRPRTKSIEGKPVPIMVKSHPTLQHQVTQIAQQGIRNGVPRTSNQRNPPPQLPDSPPKPIAPIRILKSQPQSTGSTMTATLAQSSPVRVEPSLIDMYDRESLGRLAESTKLLLQTVLSETEVIKSNTEQISKDLKAALDKCKDPPLTVSDLEKLNCLPLVELSEELASKQAENPVIDTLDLEKQVESARREAELLEVRLNDVIRKNMASDIETLRKKGPEQKYRGAKTAQDKKN